ncbi:TRAP transporter large permease [Oceanibacterium hippocampi]|uniref:TRAP transporter large permease protein n=1 Tax=Oceanibacterium hippocampi TaxID=745714 RepID=A0A1Y5RBV2_9PROT|nr:TRAP transporter large permease [Oceanibacterium hippocampi]SLN13022.1 Sialic acid TRAP transporter permease protein SiaT [Oceanibacterium hippocampi]
MDWTLVLPVGFAALFALFMFGVPVFVAFFLINIVGTWVLIGTRGFGMFANSIFETTTSVPLVTIPLFILLGEILFRSGTMDVLFNAVDKLTGRVRGRQYLVVINLSVLLGALSGAGMAVAAMMGRSVLPIMVSRGYDKTMSSGLILGGCSLAPIIPPSILVIIIGTLSDTSIAALLVAGIIPGILLALMFIAYVYGRLSLRRERYDDRVDPSSLGEKGRAVLQILPFTLIIFSVMGFILMGIATPTEAAATGVGAAVLAAAFNRCLNFAMIRDSLVSAAGISAMILVIMASSKMFTQLLAYTGATRGVIEAVTATSLDPSVMFLLMMLAPFILCMFVDQIALMLVVIPVYAPLLPILGFDPVWFWTIFLLNITVGGITPPFGYALFALKGSTDLLSTAVVFRSAWPVVLIFLIAMTLLWAVPRLITFLPSLL